MSAGVPAGPVATVGEAIGAMEAIGAGLPLTDGLACFNRMYLIVTVTVGAHIGEGFADPAFMTRLDVAFANLYLQAVDAWAARAAMARSWSVLFGARDNGDIAPLQFALAGLNAHVNHDLPLAVVQTCRELGTEPTDAHRADFDKVNAILGQVEEGIQQSFESGVILDLDRRFGGLDNLAATFSLTAARQVAWGNAGTLWHLHGNRWLSGAFLENLDRLVAFAGRGLLVPLA